MADCLQRAGAVCLNVKVIRPSMLQESTEPERDRWVDPRGRVQGQAKSHQPALQPFFFFFLPVTESYPYRFRVLKVQLIFPALFKAVTCSCG